MITSIRSAVTTVVAAVVAALAIATAAAGPVAAEPPGPAPAVVVDGFAVDHIPAGVGGNLSDFTYHWEGVAFRSRVWERGPDAAGAYAVDLTVKTLRGAPLCDAAALLSFLGRYDEQDPAGWREIDPGRVWLRPGAVVRFVEPGLATEVSLDDTRFPEAELLATAAGVHPVQPAPSGSAPSGSAPCGSASSGTARSGSGELA